MEKTLLSYLWLHSKKQQLIILGITFLSFPILYASLELPKIIINDALNGTGFPREYGPFELGQITYLFVLCLGFLGLVLLNNAVKYTLNLYRGLTGERLLRRLRFELYQRILRFPPTRFRHVSSGELIPMMTSEIEALGGFASSIIATPAFQGGTLLVYLSFIFMQDAFLGAAAIASYPLQLYLIPKLQRRILLLSRERIKNIRKISQNIDESIHGILEIHTNDTTRWHLATLSERLYTIFKIRYKIYKLKYALKFLNNFMNQLTPFIFYLAGGYLVIEGSMSFGALVAVLAAYKDLAGPWKELLSFYESFSDMEIKYQTVIENFIPPDLYPLTRFGERSTCVLSGPITFTSVQIWPEGNGHDVPPLSFSFPEKKEIALVGTDSSGRSEILQMAAGILNPSIGRVEIGDVGLHTCPESLLAHKIGYVNQNAHLFTGTIRDNLFYGLRHRPIQKLSFLNPEEERYRREAEATGNSTDPLEAIWEDFEEAGAIDKEALEREALVLIQEFGFDQDLYEMGLHSRLKLKEGDAQAAPLIQKILQIRNKVSEKVLEDKDLSNCVELWDENHFNRNAPLAENLLYGAPSDPQRSLCTIPQDPLIRDFLEETGLGDRLVQIGLKTAEMVIKLLPEGGKKAEKADYTAYEEGLTFIDPEELADYELLLRKFSLSDDIYLFSPEESNHLMGLALKLIPAQHRFGVIDEQIEGEIVEARHHLRALLEKRSQDYALFDCSAYNPSLSIEDNLLFGRIRSERYSARQKVDALLRTLIQEEGVQEAILLAGLEFHVGVVGSLLSTAQRQKIAVLRVLLKRPEILILDEVATGSGESDILLREKIRCLYQGRSLIFGSATLSLGYEFPQAFLIDNGRLTFLSPLSVSKTEQDLPHDDH